TSTVTREVMRNGGPREYRADRAHHAAGQRARRSTPARPKKAQTAAVADHGYGRDEAAVRACEQRLVELFAAIGLQQMTSRVLAFMCVTDSGSVTAAELAQHLAVSPASISKAVGLLEQQEMIRRERAAGQRNDRYIVGEDVLYQAVVGNFRHNTALAKTAYDCVSILGPETPAGARLEGLGQLLDHLSHYLLQWMELWPQVRSTREIAQPVVDG
ncbi:MarR family transcriptional regulator, partial [Streptomyces spectabilis]|uniref:GbsR/MarR family transcriptional regulator n=1 Tax=Streptomyces spectabilis TaxID=68270 RepID=UPI0033C3D4B8